MDIKPKVGIICCSGEEIPAGTISRLAVRRVLETLRPEAAVTLCLPLFLAGGEEEREFARRHPTIAVDGCDKFCARRGTEMHSGPVAGSLNVAEILGELHPNTHRSTRQQGEDDVAAVWLVAERIAAEVDRIRADEARSSAAPARESAASCACSRPVPAINLEIRSRQVPVTGLTLIFDHLRSNGLAPESDCGDALLETVKIYHPIPEEETGSYREALLRAYRQYRRSK